MKAKTKKFSHKLLALFLAVLMAMSCMSGAFMAYAAADKDYHDGNVTYNSLAWAELQDEQTAAALLDYLDTVLAGANLNVNVSLSVLGSLNGHIDSVSGLLDLINQVYLLLKNNSALLGMAGDAGNINLKPIANLSYNSNNNESACGKAYREVNDAKTILNTIFQLVYENTTASNSVIKEFLSGTFDLGVANSALDVYGLVGGLLGLDSNWENTYNGGTAYEDNLVYNVVKSLFVGGFYPVGSEAYASAITLKIDDLAMKLLSEELLQKININVTYNDGTSSMDRYAAGNIDSHLKYTTKEETKTDSDKGWDGNVYLFWYDFNGDGDFDDAGESLDITNSTNLFDFSYQALKLAWNSVLKDTLGLLNSSVKNFDYNYYYYCIGNSLTPNYSEATVTAWAQYECDQAAGNLVQGDVLGEQYADAATYLLYVKDQLNYDRGVVENPKYNWQDIDSTRLFNELRYSPLADQYFNMQTGPLNLCISETGIGALENFNWDNYTSIVGGLNDFLVTAMGVLFPDKANIDGTAPTLTTIGNTTDATTISTTLVSNALKVVQYVADATDKNILSGFYNANGATAKLTEANLESSMLPLLVSCLQNITMTKQIHDEEWDACKDAEGVAYVALTEYLSYILPNRDYTSLVTKDTNGYYNVSFENAIMPMARDAVAYVMYQYVPIKGTDGNDWNPYTSPVNSSTTIFDILNSVVVYYANDMGVGNLLGVCDTSGTCLIKSSNTLWQNIDLVANKLLPVIGSLTGDGYGNVDSYGLIYRDLIQGILDIGPNSGVTNIVSKLVTICTNEYISTTPAVKSVYKIVQDLLNGLFTARYTASGQTYVNPVPDASSNTPFDDVLQRNVITGVKGTDSDIGIIGKAIINFVEFCGNYTYPDTIWPGAMFAVQAVSSFIPSFLKDIGEYNLDTASFELANPTVTTYGYESQSTTLNITNNSNGINRAGIDINGDVQQLTRYYVQIEDITTDQPSLNISYSQGAKVSPQDTLKVSVAGSVPASAFNNSICLVTYTVTYTYVDASGNPISEALTNVTSNAYQYFTTENDWQTSTYNSDHSFTESFTPKSSMQNGTYSSMTGSFKRTGTVGLYKYMCLQYPNYVIANTSNLEALNSTYVSLVNKTNGEYSVDGVYGYSDTYGNGYGSATIDTATGNVLNMNFYDYFQATLDGDGNVQYNEDGSVVGNWVKTNPKSLADVKSLMSSDPTVIDYRHHVILEMTKGDNEGTAAGYVFTDNTANISYSGDDGTVTGTITAQLDPKIERNADGTYSNVYLKAFTQLLDNPNGDANDPTWTTGINGIYFTMGKTKASKDSSYNLQFIAYDGTTEIQPGHYSSNIHFYRSADAKDVTNWGIYVCDDSEKSPVLKQYNEGLEFLSQYGPSDFKDYIAESESSATYDYYLQTVKDSLAAMSTAINVNNAETIGSVKAYNDKTKTTTDFYGDKAYTPTTTTAPSIIVKCEQSNGYYYQTYYTDKGSNTPVLENAVYNNTPLADSGVSGTYSYTVGTGEDAQSYTAGVDATGEKVVKVDGVWYYLNAPIYDKEWKDVGTGEGALYGSPYYDNTTTQSKDSSGKLLYSVKQFTYANADGDKMTSKQAWTYKLADTSYSVVDGSANRGVYKIAGDKLEYAQNLALDTIEVKGGAEMLYNDIMLLRQGLNNVNFGIVTYEKMASAGREAESLISVDRYRDYIYTNPNTREETNAFGCLDSEFDATLAAYNTAHSTDYKSYELKGTEDLTKIQITSNASSFQINEALRLFNVYLSYLVERGYIGDKLESEIKCATGSAYTAMTTSVDGNDVAHVNTTASTVEYGALTGTEITNTGSVIYTEESWNAYITALAAAVDGATLGNNGYTYKASNYYVPTDKDNYSLQVSDVNTLRTDLMLAENNLTEAVPVSTGITVTGNLKQMLNTSGAMGNVAPNLTVTIGDLTTTTDENGVFTLTEVPEDATTITISGATTIDRTMTIDATAAVDGVLSLGDIAIICCDYSKDTSIDVKDKALFSSAFGDESKYGVFFDFNGDSTVDAKDLAAFNSFFGTNTTGIYG